ncbi:creatininase family protein [Bacillota bacterium Meth-B3]|nr:creatininase family protein [Christensenellaceae bacterium]
MNLIDMFYREIEDAKKRRVPLIIPIGTIEYHAEHASCGCDTMVITGVLERLGAQKEVVVAPPIWYGVASYAVSGPEKGTIQVDVDAYEAYLTEILKSLVLGGWRNIYLVYHHQSEAGVLMPMTLACMKAAKKVTMDHMETARGMGWWGDNSTRDYYENLETDLNPLTFIKTVPLMDAQAQIDCGGFDHAGKFETSLLSAVYPENVDFERAAWNTEWFAIPAKDASPELGEKMAALALEYLKKTII